MIFPQRAANTRFQPLRRCFAIGPIANLDGEAFQAQERLRAGLERHYDWDSADRDSKVPTRMKFWHTLRTRRQGDAAIAQTLLKHWDCRRGIVFALGDCDAGVERNRASAAWRDNPTSVREELIGEYLTVGLIAHRRLSIAACGNAHAHNQRHDR
jgi:hypothetical protein